MNSKLKNIVKIDDFIEFCEKNKKYCEDNKNLLCKKTLELTGYKVPKLLDKHYFSIYNDYCSILKDIHTIIDNDAEYKPNVGKYDKLQKEKVYIFCNNNLECSDKLKKFLEVNGIKLDSIEKIKEKIILKQNMKNVKVYLNRHDKDTVIIKKIGGSNIKQKNKFLKFFKFGK